MIIDRRRVSRDRSTENRARFIKRNKEAIKRNLNDVLNNRTLGESASQGGRVVVRNKGTKEPHFHYGPGGQQDIVVPGNEHYSEGDPLAKPYSQTGKGKGKGAGDGEGEDDFLIDLSKDEFQDLIFEDCELPRLEKTEQVKSKEVERFTAGFQPDGSPARLSVVRSYKQSLVRRIAQRGVFQAEIELLEAEIVSAFRLAGSKLPDDVILSEARADPLDLLLFPHHLRPAAARYRELLVKKDTLPLFEDDDLRYRSVTTRSKPSSHATMVMIMDNSGSMGEREKTIARKFFLILYLFLKRQYEEVDLRFISHTTTAKEMDEEEFFNTRESGGTLVSSALDVLSGIIKELRGKTNIYVAQVSDGDNMDTDNGTCTEMIEDNILSAVRYFAYVQVDDYHSSSTSMQTDLLNYGKGLWRSYQTLADAHKEFNIKRVTSDKDIVGVFRELFKKA